MDSNQFANLLRKSLELREVSIGCGGIEISNPDDLQLEQLGYSVSPDGVDLCGNNPGDWQKNWLVFGHDSCVDDPIFVDLEAEGLPVYTAMHGVGDWDPSLIADSFESFLEALKALATLARDRENPVKLEANPISTAERGAYLAQVREYNPRADLLFWKLLSRNYLDDDYSG